MTFLELASQWLYCKISDADNVAGVPVFWWQRSAKVIQFLAGSVILIEIMGIDRIRNAGYQLDRIFSWEKVFSWPDIIKKPVAVLRATQKLSRAPLPEPKEIDQTVYAPNGRAVCNFRIRNPNYSEEGNRQIEIDRRFLKDNLEKAKALPGLNFIWWVPWLIAYALGTYLIYFCIGKDSSHIKDVFIIFSSIMGILFFAIDNIFLFMFAVLIRMPFVLLGVLIIDPMGKLLASERFKIGALVASFILFIFGFFIDISFS